MILLLVILIGVAAAVIDQHTGRHLARLTFFNQFCLFLMLLMILNMVGGK